MSVAAGTSIQVGTDIGYRTKDTLYVRKQYANISPSSFGYNGPALKVVVLSEEQFSSYLRAQQLVAYVDKQTNDPEKRIALITKLQSDAKAEAERKQKLNKEIDDLEKRIERKMAKMAAKAAKEAEAKNVTPNKKVEPAPLKPPALNLPKSVPASTSTPMNTSRK